jgi:hypothetical protein
MPDLLSLAGARPGELLKLTTGVIYGAGQLQSRYSTRLRSCESV